MSRWIVFDRPAAKALQSRAGVVPELRPDAVPSAKIVELALNSGASLAVVPGEEAGRVLLMRVSQRPQAQLDPATKPPEKSAANVAPAGFLGLSDAIDMDSEPERPKKWWQRILD